MAETNLILIGVLASVGAGLATGVGALPVLFLKDVPDRLFDSMLGFAAGVMLAATSFSLIVPAIDLGGVWITALGIFLGVLFFDQVDKLTPHMHFISGSEGPSSNLRKVWLFIFAITIHNFPEGLAVGVSFGSGDIAAGIALAIGIGLQNMPEGLAVALPLLREKYSKYRAVGIATLTGLAEPIAALFGVVVVTIAKPILPLGLAFAAGAMFFVVIDEIIPESHSRGFEREATFGAAIGFALMTILDNMFA